MYVKEECSREDRGGTRPESGRAPRFESRRFRAFEEACTEFVQICGWPSRCGEMAPQAACVHEGGGVERRAAHHERERQRRRREAAGGSTEPAAEEATDVEAVSAADVLAGVEESGPNYALPTAREGQRERRERLRVDETAKQAGHTIVETGTHVEILGEQGLWWPATIAGREENVDGRLVHEVEYDGCQGEQYWHMLDDEQCQWSGHRGK